MTAFVCPGCGGPTLEITASIDIPPDPEWDEEALQTVACEACGFRGVVRYSESRRGALDDEAWWHQGMPVLEATYLRVRDAIARGLPGGVPPYGTHGEWFEMVTASPPASGSARG